MDKISIKMLKKVVDTVGDSPLPFSFYDLKKDRSGPTKGAYLSVKDGKKITETQHKAFRKEGKSKAGKEKVSIGTLSKVDGKYVFDVDDDSKTKAQELYLGCGQTSKAGVPKLAKDKVIVQLRGVALDPGELEDKEDDPEDRLVDLEDEFEGDMVVSRLPGVAGSGARDTVREMLKRVDHKRSLGSGGFGTVDLVETQSGLPLAIKTANDISKIKSLRSEAAIYEDIGDHPNIGKCYGLVEDGGTAQLVLKPILGDSLSSAFNDCHNALAGGIISKAEFEAIVSHLMRGTLRGLKAIADAGYVHHDIKGANVMLDLETMEPQIIDVGGSKQVGEGGYAYTHGYHDQVSKDEKADVFSMGALTYRAREGEPLILKAYKVFAYVVDQDQKRRLAADEIAQGRVGPTQPSQGKVKEETGDVAPEGHTLAYVTFQDGMMNPDRSKRFTLDEALAHPFIDDPALDSDAAKEALAKVTKRRAGRRDRKRDLLDQVRRENPKTLTAQVGSLGAATRSFVANTKQTCREVDSGTTEADALDMIEALRDGYVERLDSADETLTRYRTILNQLALDGADKGPTTRDMQVAVKALSPRVEKIRVQLQFARELIEAARNGKWATTFGAATEPLFLAAEQLAPVVASVLPTLDEERTRGQDLLARARDLAGQDEPDGAALADLRVAHQTLLATHRTRTELLDTWTPVYDAAIDATHRDRVSIHYKRTQALHSQLTEYRTLLGQLNDALQDAKVPFAKLGASDPAVLAAKKAAAVRHALAAAATAWSEAKAAFPGELEGEYDYATLDERVRVGLSAASKLEGPGPIGDKALRAMTSALRVAVSLCEVRASELPTHHWKLLGPLTSARFLADGDLGAFAADWATVDPAATSLDDLDELASRVTTLAARYVELRDRGLKALDTRLAERGTVLEIATPVMDKAMEWKEEAKDWLADYREMRQEIVAGFKDGAVARARSDWDTVRETLADLDVWANNVEVATSDLADMRDLVTRLRGLDRYTEYSFHPVAKKLVEGLESLIRRADTSLPQLEDAVAAMQGWRAALPAPEPELPEPREPQQGQGEVPNDPLLEDSVDSASSLY